MFKFLFMNFNSSVYRHFNFRSADCGTKIETSSQSSPIQIIRNEQQLPKIIKVTFKYGVIRPVAVSDAIGCFE